MSSSLSALEMYGTQDKCEGTQGKRVSPSIDILVLSFLRVEPLFKNTFGRQNFLFGILRTPKVEKSGRALKITSFAIGTILSIINTVAL